jgi:Flp pilus assembly protein TadD
MAALQKELELEKARRSALELVAAGLQDRLRTVQAAGVDVAPADAGPGLKPSEVAPVPDALVLGRELLAAGRIDEALPVLSGAAQSAPESTDALTLLGRVFASKGLPDAAEAVLQRALRIDPKCGAAHFELTRVHLGRTPPELAAARLHYQAARQLGVPADPGLEASMADAARQPAGQVR